ncbi:hypothetical protein BDY17DRAFT_305256 [Neohortaea acidophila]|uniref:SH3 domain-containing protein n=1 Tax=Neohortaea acidophila TaxID=245834 RepID=A0A6A6PH01_9PEZI|nr:uncharacterized protein BDY17DRAFT_305256 [Neohortaea acidophila]KAF2479260.1 hypothetical protein BDY17DRAFT_305256 [Neohortaea acidophila]
MPWRPLPGGAVAFAVCSHPFQATRPEDLPLQIGDNLYIIELGGPDQEWCRGYLVAPPSLLSGLTSERGQHLDHRVFTGIFPRNCVEVRELVGENKSNGDTSNGPVGGLDGADDEHEEDVAEKRKSQVYNLRRLSKALTKRMSVGDLIPRRERPALVSVADPLLRDANGSKPLAPVPMLRVGDEAGQAVEEPLVDEIASCLREWHDERLHEMLLSKGNIEFGPITELIKRLDTSRKQLLHDVLTGTELVKVREDTVWDLVAGNKMMNDDIIVRSPSEGGRILTAQDSVIDMTKLQANMSILDRPPQTSVDPHKHYHVLVDVRNIVGNLEAPATLQIYLCAKAFGEKARTISEAYSITLPVPAELSDDAAKQTKTLFIDLSNTDVGIGTDTSQLYVIFRLIRDEPVRQTITPQSSIGHLQKPSISSLSEASMAGQRSPTIKGRRSVLRKNPSIRGGIDSASRPETGLSQRTEGYSSHSRSDSSRLRETKMVKRIAGVGAVDIGKVARQQSVLVTDVTLWAPNFSMEEDKSNETEDWSEVIRDVLRSANGSYSRVGILKRFEVGITAFAESDLEALYRNNPTQLFNVHMTPKIGFSGVPTEKRNDIYLTLAEPLLARNAALLHSKFGNIPLSQRSHSAMSNLQLTLEVRRANGERIENCIFTSANTDGHTAWRTTGVEREEAWNQTIRLVVPTEDIPGSHVVMSIADAPNFPFALAWIPLWEAEAFVRDGEHQVALYVYDEYSSSMIGGKGAYLALPPWHDKKNEPAYGTSATILVSTFLCSTAYSQDPTLLGLLNWRNFHGSELIELLERFPFVPEIEIVKLLEYIILSLFQMLDEYAGSEVYEDPIFYNFVIIMGIARDRRFSLDNVIENHAPSLHDWPSASQSLVKAYQRLVSNPMDSSSSRKLRATLKVGDQMLRLIVETKKERPHSSHQVNGDSDPDSSERHPDFAHDLQRLFVAVMALMRNPMAILLGTQTLVVQHFHTWLPELASLMPPADIFEVATNMLDACAHAKGKLILHRLVLIWHYTHLDIFKTPEVRALLIANTLRWLDPYWGENPDVTNQWSSQVRLCCSIVAAQMEEMGDGGCQYIPKMVSSYAALQNSPHEAKKSFSLLFPCTYPFPTKSTPNEITVDEARLELTALLAATMTSQHRLHFDTSQVDVAAVLLQCLKVQQSVLNGEAFSKTWLSLYVVHHRFVITGLERIYEALVDLLPHTSGADMADAIEFDTDLWRAFFDTLFMAVSSPALAMETFPEQKRRAIWKIAGDVREMGADLVRRSWNAMGWETDPESRELHGFERMGGYQVQFVPDLIPSIVELCLSVHAGLRSVAIEVLRTMIISSWELDQDLSIVQSTMVDCLDRLCRSKEMTETIVRTTFINEMAEQFQPLQQSIEDSLYNAVMEMFRKIAALLVLLTKVHQGGVGNETMRIVDTLRLMESLKDVQSEGAFVRYVHQLAALQVAAGNHTEAGLALKMHADRYEWNPNTQLPALTDPQMPAQTAFERKEGLYFDLCQHFEKGNAWQSALMAYHELAMQYAQNTFDYSKLARAQRSQATMHERIARGDRVVPRYFRVVYKGFDFPLSVRDKEFIFEGQPSDRLAAFEERLQQEHPNATILHSPTEPDIDGQYLHVYPVSPNKDLNHMVYQRMRVSQAAREYALMSNPQLFTTTSRQPQYDVPITEQVVEKTIYTTAEPFPTLLRRSEIVATDTITLSPIQAAVERTTRKTQELYALEKRVENGEDGDIMGRLSDEILLSVDPDSDSSVARYRTLLPSSEQGDVTSEDATYSMLEREADEAMDPMQNALNVALLDHAIAIRRCLARFTRSEHRATKAELVPRFETTFERELALLFPQKEAAAAGFVEEQPDGPLPEVNPKTLVAVVDPRRTAEPEVVPGAQEPVPTQGEDQRSRSRRRSFLRRIGSNSSNRLPVNGTGPANTTAGGGIDNNDDSTSRPRSRSNSRQRSGSLTRRLSFFRSSSRDRGADAQERRPSVSSRVSDKASSVSGGGGLKTRLSFLKIANRSGLTGGRDGEEY